MVENEPPGGAEVEQLDHGFVLDADFDASDLAPPPQPWYRAPGAITAMGAIGVAVVALTVSVVLLVARTSSDTTQSVEPTVVGDAVPSSAVPSSAVTTTATTSGSAEPSPESSPESPSPTPVQAVAPEPEVPAEPEVTAEPAPEVSLVAPAPSTERVTNPTTVLAPTNVTRAPVTRSPISVLPPR